MPKLSHSKVKLSQVLVPFHREELTHILSSEDHFKGLGCIFTFFEDFTLHFQLDIGLKQEEL